MEEQERPTAPTTTAPTLVARQRDARAQDERDREILHWIARFRFVDAARLAERFGVSKEKTSARVRRLERAGLVTRSGTPGGTAGWTISVTRRGMRALGLPPRRPARTDLQREHELAVAWLVTRLETRGDGAIVYTERECRARERATGIRHSADLSDRGGRTTRRWPDLILEHADGRRIVIEFERTVKGADRMSGILAAYRRAEWFDAVWLLAGDRAVARMIAGRLHAAPVPLPGYPDPVTNPNEPAIRLAPGPGLDPAARQAVQTAIDRASSRGGRRPR